MTKVKVSSGDEYELLSSVYGSMDSGGELNLHSTSNVTKGVIRMDELTGLIVEGYAQVGSGAPPANTGSGVLTSDRLSVGDPTIVMAIGVEAQVFGDFLVSGYGAFGTMSAPSNTTAGDVTMQRLTVLGSSSDAAHAVSNGLIATFFGTITDTSGTVVGYHYGPFLAPASASTAAFRILNMSAVVSPPNDDTALGSISTAVLEVDYQAYKTAGGVDTDGLVGLVINPMTLRTTNNTRQDVVNLWGLDMTVYNRPSGTGTVTVTSDMYHIRLRGALNAGLTLDGQLYYIYMANSSASNTYSGNVYGVVFEQLTRGVQNYATYSLGNRSLIAISSSLGQGVSALTRTMAGLELEGGNNTTNKYTAALKFMSGDSAFITENPKLLAAIAGAATETFNGDTKGGMDIVAFATANTPGTTNVPTEVFRVGVNRLAFFGVTPVTARPDYTLTNVSVDRAFNADTVLIAELADVVGTLINDLIAYGLLQ